MDPQDDVQTLAVGPAPLDEEAMLLLSRARTVAGPAALVAAVAHLCPPTTGIVRGDVPPDVPRPLVVLVPAGEVPGG